MNQVGIKWLDSVLYLKIIWGSFQYLFCSVKLTQNNNQLSDSKALNNTYVVI